MLQTVHLHYEEYVYNQIIKATNDGKDYYIIGEMQNVPNTLLVTLVGGNGGGRFLCLKHGSVYLISEKCTDCQNAPRDEANDASVTSCDTPEIQR